MSVDVISEQFRRAIERPTVGEEAQDIEALVESIRLSNLTQEQLRELLERIINMCYENRMRREVRNARNNARPRFRTNSAN